VHRTDVAERNDLFAGGHDDNIDDTAVGEDVAEQHAGGQYNHCGANDNERGADDVTA